MNLVNAVLAALLAVQVPYSGGIVILDTGFVAYQPTRNDAGPAVGDMLNAHFFPGINNYLGGYYSQAVSQFDYVIGRPQFLEGNPRKAEFLSTSHYLRGMVFVYHAEGLGRYGVAKEDFEAAIELNPMNYSAYLELSRVYSTLGLKGEAIAVLRTALELRPADEEVDELRMELDRIDQPQAQSSRGSTN